jgi:hypothetical protein
MQKDNDLRVVPAREVHLNGFIRAVRIADKNGAAAPHELVEPLTDDFVQLRNHP